MTIAEDRVQETPTVVPEPTNGRAERRKPRWERTALLALLMATGVLYIWGLGKSGWANAYYSAAVQAGSQSWKAMFFGSFDSSNFITVDKTPASLWVMSISARIFGVNSWSILVPQALEGVAAVGVLYAAVRRWFGPAAGLLAGGVMALTPVAVLMFRFNNPDALLVLLLVAGAYAVTRAVEQGKTRWLLLAGGLVGFAFLAKMLQALLVVPAFGLVYLIAAPVGFWKRVWQLLAALGAMIAGAGWWIAIVSLWPASSRPYIGGSQSNSILELTLGYNGFGRLTGEEVGSVGGGGGGNGGMWGSTGLTRLFDGEIGGQVAWLLPAAVIFLIGGLLLSLRAARTSRMRAGLLLWGGWLLVTAGTFSFMAGIFHAYYTVALAPAIGALIGIGAVSLWQHRAHVMARSILAAALSVTAVWSSVLLGRSADFVPWLRTSVVVVGLLAAAALLALPWLRWRRVAVVVAAVGIAVGLAGPAAYALDTAATAHTGSIPTAGPSVQGSGFGGRMGGGGQRGGFGNGGLQPPNMGTQNGAVQPGNGQMGFPGTGTRTDGGFRMGGGAGGLLAASTPDSELVKLLQTDADQYAWAGAAVGSQNAAGYQLGSGEPVMSLGGFNGSDPSISLADFQKLVEQKKIHYFLGGSGFGGMSNGGSNSASQIASWVTQNFTAETVGGVTVYDLTR
ncbi:MAG: glycosyltransferase family 39 protein [Hamadaea sp.]|uniref:ArnT family glycosyltransferase n=1 Tax=Hamadaea sp. TaxID=2024425 RepID=UPI0017A64C9C|nr:glycosyltransferase family 39 protein [Hamadaea sp.]NUR69614.1 glycosyltransferase family 39 protein [Hamadaea sp.]NUT24115.1 glycosyltransferase family 39 protein [Hamadaea sp.]